jgi:WD40 repeat protein
VAVWDLLSGRLLQILVGNSRSANNAAFLDDDTRIISGSLDDSVRIWDIARGREDWHGEFGLGGVRALDVAPDGKTAAWGGFDRRIIVWDLEHRRRKFECSTAACFVSALKFSPDGSMLAAAGYEATVRIYDMRSGTELYNLALAETGDRKRSHSSH